MSASVPQFLMGMSARFLLSCAGWTSIRMLRAAAVPSTSSPASSSSSSSHNNSNKKSSSSPPTYYSVKESIRRAWIKNASYLKMWISSFALETSVSALILPGPFIVGKHVTRVMLDSFMPIFSDMLFKIDNFSHAAFLSFASKSLIRAAPPNAFHNPTPANSRSISNKRNAELSAENSTTSFDSSSTASGNNNNTSGAVSSSSGGGTTSNNNNNNNPTVGGVTGGAAAVSNAFVYHLPATILHLVKLIIRTHRYGMRRTRFFRCLGVIGVQYAAKVPLMSFATMLPMSDSELAFCTICMVIDKCSDAYLYYHTFPFPEWVSGSGIVSVKTSDDKTS